MSEGFDGYYDGLSVRRLFTDEIIAVLTLQEIVYNAMPEKNQLVLSTEEEFAVSLKDDFCVGAFDGDVLIAVTTMIMNRECERNIGGIIGFNPLECVTYDTTFVHPDYRGRGIQRRFITVKDDAARKSGAKYAFSTVSPENSYSLNNVLSGGFEIIERRTMYSGYERYIMKKIL